MNVSNVPKKLHHQTVHRISRRQAGKVAHKTETNAEEAGGPLDEGTAPPMTTTDENSPSQAVTKVASETDADKNSDKNSGPGPESSSEEKSDSKENPKCDTKKTTKTRVKRPFGSIRCRSVRLGVFTTFDFLLDVHILPLSFSLSLLSSIRIRCCSGRLAKAFSRLLNLSLCPCTAFVSSSL